MEGEPTRAYRRTSQTLHDGAHAPLLNTQTLAWRVEGALVGLTSSREGALHIIMPLSGSLGKQIVLGIDEWPEGVRNSIGSLLLPN